MAKRGARIVVAGFAVVVVAAAVASCRGAGGGAGDNPSERIVPTRVGVTVEGEFAAGRSFDVSYRSLDATLDPARIAPGVVLELWRGGEKLHYLVSAGGSRTVLPPDDPPVLPQPELLGPGPYVFDLPGELVPGRYVVCGYVGEGGRNVDDPGPPRERWCEPITVQR